MLSQLMAATTPESTISSQVADMAAPLGGAVTEGSFSHVFSTMAIQIFPEPRIQDVLSQWARLLTPHGIVAIGVGEINEDCGLHAIWSEAAEAANPQYVNPPLLPVGHWRDRADLVEGLERTGFWDVRSGVLELGFMRFFWESGNSMPEARKKTFGGDLERIKKEMERILDERYEGERKIPLRAGLAVARRPKAG